MHAISGYIDGNAVIANESISSYEGRNVIITILDTARNGQLECQTTDEYKKTIARKLAGLWKDYNNESTVDPRYVCLLDNAGQNTFAIAPCEEKMVTSFKVPEGFPEKQRIEFRIHSMEYIKSIQKRASWIKESTLLIGSYDEEHNAAVFSLQKEDQTNAQAN